MRTRPTALLLVLATVAAAQRGKPDEDAWREDPYTKDDPEAVERLGYVKIDHFLWANDFDTRRIELELGRVKVRWIETPHFKLGSELAPIKVPFERGAKTALLRELAELKKKLPKVDARRPKQLDPWLRAHLYAQRLEAHYARVQELLGVTDADFPDGAGELVDGRFMGRGKFLGTPTKHTVLLCQKASTCDRFMSTFAQREEQGPARFWFDGSDTFFVGTAAEFGEGAFQDDEYLHSHIVFSLTHNLLDGFKGYAYVTPVWWKEGLAHYYSRQICDKPNYTGLQDASERSYGDEDWRPDVRARVRYEIAPAWREHLEVFDFGQLRKADHQVLWSRFDWLMTTAPEQVGRFVGLVKGYVHTEPGLPSRETLLQVQADAIREVWECDVDELEHRWAEWVMKTYPKK